MGIRGAREKTERASDSINKSDRGNKHKTRAKEEAKHKHWRNGNKTRKKRSQNKAEKNKWKREVKAEGGEKGKRER